MTKMRPRSAALLVGTIFIVFAWVAQAPRSWEDSAVRSRGAPGELSGSLIAPRPPRFARAPQEENFALPPELVQAAIQSHAATLERMALPRREAEILPIVASRISLEPAAALSVPSAPEEGLSADASCEEACTGEVFPAQLAQEKWSSQSTSSEESEIAPPAAHDYESEAELSDRETLAADEASEPGAAWPLPQSLLAQLDDLAGVPFCAAWVRDTQTELRRLSRLTELEAPEAAATLDALTGLAERAQHIANSASAAEEQSRLAATGYALSRRLAVWRRVHDLASAPGALEIPVTTEPERILDRLEAADAALERSPHARDWRRYLLTAQTRLLAEAGLAVDPHHRRRHARQVLRRMEWSGLTAAQQRFLARPEFVTLTQELRTWAAEPFDFPRLLETLEDYEEQPASITARRLAETRRRLAWTEEPTAVELAAHLDAHYRNANVRAAISQELLMLLAPEAQTSWDRVQDTIAGASVNGRSQTTSQVAFRVLPDSHRLRLVLEATGQAISTTRSSKSGAVFHSRGQSWFRAQKEIIFDGGRVTMAPAVAEATVSDRLREISTDYDNVPLVNIVAQSLARQGHADARYTARREAEHKVAQRVARRLDEEAEKRLAELEARLKGVLLPPLEQLALEPTPIELQTTSQRLIGRYRLAGDLQLGAHTPRPQAPADSLLSVQLHESAVNNALNRLPLAGREVDLPTLVRDLAAVAGATDVEVPDDLPEDVVIRFPEEDALRVDLMDGLARVTICVEELETENRRWRKVMSRAYYRPESDGLKAYLAREGHLELVGERLRLRDQIALRAIFAKVFSERRTLPLTPEKVAAAPQLQPCQITQLTIRDGWLGLAIGPERAPQGRTARK